MLAVLGLPLFGLPGLVAIALGAVAVGALNANRGLKGTGLAVAAIVLGVLQIVGWTTTLCLFLLTRQAESPATALGPAMGEQFDLADVADAPAHIRRAIQSNVMVVARGLGRASEGSGVVVDGRQDEVFVVTNRHVIADSSASALDTRIEGTFPDGSRAPGTVVWQGEEAIDVAVLRCPLVSEGFETASLRAASTLNIGESVFAIGNPLGLGWSYSGGAVSAIRRFASDGRLLFKGAGSEQVRDQVSHSLPVIDSLDGVLKLAGKAVIRLSEYLCPVASGQQPYTLQDVKDLSLAPPAPVSLPANLPGLSAF